MAGSNAIGTGAVVLTTTADELTAGLAKAQGEIGQFGKTAGENLSKSLDAATSGSSGIFSKITAGISAAIPVAGGIMLQAGTAIGSALIAGFEMSLKRLDDQKVGRLIDALDAIGTV